MDVLVFLLIISSAIFHASWNLVLRKVSGNIIVVWLSLFVGGLTMLPIVIGNAYLKGLSASVTQTGLICVFASAVVHTVYFCMLARAYQKGEISFVYPVTRGAGIAITAIFALLVLNESISLLGMLGIGLILTGIFLIASKGFLDNKSSEVLLMAMIVGVMVGACSLIDKVGVINIDPVLYISLLYIISGILLTPYILWNYRWVIGATVRTYPGYIMTVGQGSIGTYLLVLFAFTMGSVSYIMPMREFAVVVSVLMGVTFLKEEITIPKFLGITVISVGLICLKLG